MSIINIISLLQKGHAGSAPPPGPLPPTLRERIGTGVAKYIGTQLFENAVLEATIVKDGSALKIFYTGTKSDTEHQIAVIETNDIEAAWPLGTAVIGLGDGGAPVGRKASSSDVVKNGSSWFAYALDGYGFPGDSGNVYIYTSSDGITWSDGGLCFAVGVHAGETITNFGNTAILKNIDGTPAFVGGKYHMLCEGRVGASWQSFHAESTDLATGWTITQMLPTLEPTPGSTYGGNCAKYVDGVWHTFYHYSTVGPTLPCNVAYATSPDGLTWTIKELDVIKYSDGDPTPPTPPTLANQPYPYTDQAADIWVEEINGKVYIVAEFVDNSYSTGEIESQLWMWVFDGTFAEMVSDL
jgi:hypothetical protein